MLEITVGAQEVYDEEAGKFLNQGGFELQLEHSLVSLSKWESIHEKPFLGGQKNTGEEILSYIECMILGEKPPGNFLYELSESNLEDINTYINAKASAAWISEQAATARSSEIITADLIYYWMTIFKIPFACETWHLNRLFMLIRIANIKQGTQKKMSKSEIARRNRDLNAQRKAALGTQG